MQHWVSILLIVVGLTITAWVLSGAKGIAMAGPADDWIAGAMLVASGAMIGTGLTLPFRRTWLTWVGAFVGVVAMSVLLLTIVLMGSALNWR
jgi:hypothetical protein